MDRPVIVNSLLCFIHNFRGNPRVRSLVEEYFSKTAIAEARSLLSEKIVSSEVVAIPEDVFELYDLLVTKGDSLQFAATDLTNLPLALLSNDEDRNEILRELKTLRTFISDALDGRIEDGPRETATPNVRCKLNTSASSPEFPVLHSQVAGVCDSPKPLHSSSPIAINNPIQNPLHLTLQRTIPNSVHATAAEQTLKRKAGRSLDATVRKLSEKRKAEVVHDDSPPNGPAWQPPLDPQAYLNMIRMMQTPQTSIFSNIMGQISKLNGHSGSENGEDKTDDMAEDGDSSPSPSEETRDDFPLNEMSIDNDSDKPFICEHSNCNKRFANKFLLKKHQFIHTGLRPHTCPYCNKRFNRKDNLLRHKKTHMQNGAGEDIVRRGSLPEGISSLFPALTGFPTGLETLKVEGLDGFKIEGDEE